MAFRAKFRWWIGTPKLRGFDDSYTNSHANILPLTLDFQIALGH